MVEFSCADYTFPLLGRREALSLIKLLQFEFVDIGLFARSPNYLPSALRASPRTFIEGVQTDLADAGLRVADVFLQVGEDPAQMSANDPDPTVRQTARDAVSQALELCSAIGCTHLTGLPGVLHGNRSHDLAVAAEEAAWRVEAAASAGIVYSVEPHVGSITNDTATAHALLSRVPGLTLTLDYGHFLFQGESNDAVHKLLPHTSHVHLRGAAPGKLQTTAAESSVDLPTILRGLSPIYRGRYCLEYVYSAWHDCNRTDNVSETILLRQHVRELATTLNFGEHRNV